MAFAYFYYLLQEPQPFDLERLWREQLDWDGDGQLDEYEVRLMAIYIAGKKVREDDVEELRLLMLNASQHLPHHPPDLLDLAALRATPDLVPALEERVRAAKKFRTDLSPLDEVEFFMVTDNATRVAARLDELRVRMPKFLCLNDDMNKTHSAGAGTQAAVEALHLFFTRYFPHSSPFENDPRHPNPFLYLHQWRELQSQRVQRKQLTLWGTLLGSGLALLLLAVGVLRCLSPPARWRPLGRGRGVLIVHQRDTSPHSHPRTSTIV